MAFNTVSFIDAPPFVALWKFSPTRPSPFRYFAPLFKPGVGAIPPLGCIPVIRPSVFTFQVNKPSEYSS